jgi:hypothetical protein
VGQFDFSKHFKSCHCEAKAVAIWLIEMMRRTLLSAHQPLFFGEIATSVASRLPRNDIFFFVSIMLTHYPSTMSVFL